MDLKEEIYRGLAYCDAFNQGSLRGESGAALLPFCGTLDDTSAKEMTEAVKTACEVIDLREWR